MTVNDDDESNVEWVYWKNRAILLEQQLEVSPNLDILCLELSVAFQKVGRTDLARDVLNFGAIRFPDKAETLRQLADAIP